MQGLDAIAQVRVGDQAGSGLLVTSFAAWNRALTFEEQVGLTAELRSLQPGTTALDADRTTYEAMQAVSVASPHKHMTCEKVDVGARDVAAASASMASMGALATAKVRDVSSKPRERVITIASSDLL